jgi:hypothetical protein
VCKIHFLYVKAAGAYSYLYFKWLQYTFCILVSACFHRVGLCMHHFSYSCFSCACIWFHSNRHTKQPVYHFCSILWLKFIFVLHNRPICFICVVERGYSEITCTQFRETVKNKFVSLICYLSLLYWFLQLMKLLSVFSS